MGISIASPSKRDEEIKKWKLKKKGGAKKTN